MKRNLHLILGIIQALVALGAIPAGYLMLAEPDGKSLGMTVDVLAGTPFKDFFIPGLFLFTVNGLCNLAGSVLCFFKFSYAPAIGIALGSALVIWISVQVFSIGLTHFLQPGYFIIGIIEIILSYLLAIQNKKNSIKIQSVSKTK